MKYFISFYYKNNDESTGFANCLTPDFLVETDNSFDPHKAAEVIETMDYEKIVILFFSKLN